MTLSGDDFVDDSCESSGYNLLFPALCFFGVPAFCWDEQEGVEIVLVRPMEVEEE